MGKIIHKIGDVISSNGGMLTHSVNSAGAYGAGCAKQIRAAFPHAYEAYIYKYRRTGWKVGDVQFVHPPNLNSDPTKTIYDTIIANCCTQHYYGRSRDYNDYGAFHTVFHTVLSYAVELGLSHIAAPRMGSGLAGGSWNRIESILRDVIANYDVDAHIYSPRV